MNQLNKEKLLEYRSDDININYYNKILKSQDFFNNYQSALNKFEYDYNIWKLILVSIEADFTFNCFCFNKLSNTNNL